jgi:zinc protease
MMVLDKPALDQDRDDISALGGTTFQFGPYDGILVEDHGIPHVAVSVRVRTGSQFDPAEKEGVAQLAGEMLFRGSENYNREDLNEAIDGIGCSMNVRVQKSTMSISGDVARDQLPRFIELLCEVLFRPSFSREELDKLKRQTISEISATADDDTALARRGFGRTLFRGHPWARPTIGTEQSIKNIELADIQSFYDEHIASAPRVIGVSGDTDVDEIVGLLGQSIPSPLVDVATKEFTIGAPSTNPGRIVVLMDKPDRSQTQVIMGHATIPAKHQDMVPLSVGNTAFGGTFTSRLMQEVRVKRGWSYGAYSSFSIGRELSTFQTVFYPKTEDTIPAIELVLELLEELKTDGLPEDHINFSKSFRTNAFAFSLETHFKRLSLLMSARYLERPDNWIMGHEARTQAVTAPQVCAAFARHLKPDQLVIAITCTAKDILEQVKALPGVTAVYVQAHDKPWGPQRVFEGT